MTISDALPAATAELARLIAVIRSWRPSAHAARVSFFRALLEVQQATEALRDLVFPLEIPLHTLSSGEGAHEALQALRAGLREVQALLEGYDHRMRLVTVRERAPAYAERLERARLEALAQISTLAMRVAFLSDELELGEPVDIAELEGVALLPGSLLQ